MTLPRFERNVALSTHTTFRIGGPAKAFIEVATPDEVVEAAWRAERLGLPWQVIGHGSNILASDNGYGGTIIVFKDQSAPRIKEDGSITVSGGHPLSQLVEFMAANGAGGLENLIGIPGTVGGAIAGNAGAYGTAVSDALQSVLLLDRNGGMKKVKNSELRFAYRSSSIREGGEVVLEATFNVRKASPEELRQLLRERMADRQRKHPDWREVPTAGSYFKNPLGNGGIRMAAGKLLEEAGCSGLRVGGAYLWPTHANIIVTEKDAHARDVRRLAEMMSRRVDEKCGIALTPEVVYLE